VTIAAFATPVSEALAYESDITNYDDIAMIVVIKDASELIKEEVEACISDGGERNPCLCAASDRIDDVRAAIGEALAVHPEWQRRTLYIADTGDGQFESLTLNLGRVPYASPPRGCF
jgi:hypothetical protein